MTRTKRSPHVKDLERLLASLRACRQELVRAQAEIVIGCPQYRALDAHRETIDNLAGLLTGDREVFWRKPHSVGKGEGPPNDRS
jgi:hypothetical protein